MILLLFYKISLNSILSWERLLLAGSMIHSAKIDPAGISDIFITHQHSDHYNEEHIRYIAAAGNRVLRVWVRQGASTPEIPGVEWKIMDPFVRYETEDMAITGMPANHVPDTSPQYLLFERKGKKFLYALDGAWFLLSTYYALHQAELDLLVLDCTMGDTLGDYRIGEHNSIAMLRVMLPSLFAWHTVNDRTKILASHLAPSLHAPHEETVSILAEIGMDAAYDGMELVF
jgi:phosphoribosyl 1,2-cyclic phosphate phosphodiesterase